MSPFSDLAGFEQRQGWGILLLLTVLYLILLLNVLILLAVLPQLVRILTGYESVFRSGGLRTTAGLGHTASPDRLVSDPVAECADPSRGVAATRADTHRL